MNSDWQDKVVIVTGGSAGLGLAISERFASEGANVVMLARNETKLRQASVENAQELNWLVADVSDQASLQAAVEQIKEQFGRIDVWINNVGMSTRAQLESCPLSTYQDLMEANLYSAIRCSQIALPLLQQTSGSIVNIGSLAAKTGWPHVAPYVTAKHALAGFSHQLRLEGPKNVHCLFVCCGPIRRADAGNRYDDQAEGMNDSARKPGAGVKLKGIDPHVLARKIVLATRKRKPELIVPFYVRFLFVLQQLSPRLGDWILRRSMSKHRD